MKFKVIDTKTGGEADPDVAGKALEDAGETKLLVMPGKCSWLLDDDGSVVVSDSCGNHALANWKRYKAVITDVIFKVIDKTTGEPVEANDYADRYWEEQTKQEKKHRADPFKEKQLPYLFYRKCGWLLDTDGDLHIQDSCGNVVCMDNERFEAVVE